jgi:hypothetical protein
MAVGGLERGLGARAVVTGVSAVSRRGALCREGVRAWREDFWL